jgi:hypothetical protein
MKTTDVNAVFCTMSLYSENRAKHRNKLREKKKAEILNTKEVACSFYCILKRRPILYNSYR